LSLPQYAELLAFSVPKMAKEEKALQKVLSRVLLAVVLLFFNYF